VQYGIRSDVHSEEVIRRYKQIAWLHGQLSKEFPGLKIPEMPARELSSVSAFFNQLLSLPDVASSYLLSFFVSCASPEKFNEYANRRVSQINPAEYIKSFFVENITIKDKDLKSFEEQAADLKEIEQQKSADFLMFSESVFTTAQLLLQNFSALNNCIEDIKKLLHEVSNKFSSAAEILGNLSTHSKKLNYAKSQFPLFSNSNINLDLAFAKEKILFFNISHFTRQFDPKTGQKSR
jgi:hypothetical protein